MSAIAPQVSAWYQDLTNGSLFEVVAIDEASGTIEYQLVDGEIGEVDQPAWRAMLLAAVEAPEDWRSPYEITDDRGFDDQAMVPENFSGVLSELEAERIDLGDDFQLYESRE